MHVPLYWLAPRIYIKPGYITNFPFLLQVRTNDSYLPTCRFILNPTSGLVTMILTTRETGSGVTV